MIKWSYKTVHFELKKEGLLGSGFLDEPEIEQELNEFGQSGWELVSVLEVQDGIIAFFKQPLNLKKRSPGWQGELEVEREVIAGEEYEDPGRPEKTISAGVKDEDEPPEEPSKENGIIGAIRIE